MGEQAVPSSSATSGRAAFDERLSVPLWWYLPAAGLGVLLGAEIHMGYPGVRSWLGYAILVPLCLLALWRLGRMRIRVQDGQLIVGDRTLPLRHVGRTDAVARRDKQPALGPDLDPSAFLLHRAWIGPVVRIEVTDPEAAGVTEPYWVLSTRRPERLLAALAEESR